MTLDERDELRRQVEAQLRWCTFGSRAWSFVHHSSIGLAALLSASAAIAAKYSGISADRRADLTAILAGAAALLATLAVSGGFERKWRTNRLNRGRCRTLLIELDVPGADLAAIRAELLRIINDQDLGIIGQQSQIPSRQQAGVPGIDVDHVSGSKV